MVFLRPSCPCEPYPKEKTPLSNEFFINNKYFNDVMKYLSKSKNDGHHKIYQEFLDLQFNLIIVSNKELRLRSYKLNHPHRNLFHSDILGNIFGEY